MPFYRKDKIMLTPPLDGLPGFSINIKKQFENGMDHHSGRTID